MKATIKEKRVVMLDQIESPKHDWQSAFGHKRLCYSRATDGTFILNIIY